MNTSNERAVVGKRILALAAAATLASCATTPRFADGSQSALEVGERYGRGIQGLCPADFADSNMYASAALVLEGAGFSERDIRLFFMGQGLGCRRAHLDARLRPLPSLSDDPAEPAPNTR